MKIPENGISREGVLDQLRAYRAQDPDWREGKIFGHVFHAEDDVVDTVEQAFHLFMWDNAQDTSIFGSLRRLETEVVAMASNHVRGDEQVIGSFTSGGSESCLLAVKTARDWARENKPDIRQPEMILPITAHPCFHKAAHYFDLKPVIVPVDPVTLRADIDAVKAAVTDDTILLIGSATCFAFGTTDPIPELGQIALDRDILLHVDGCIGGFMLSVYRALGHDVPDYDFTVPGVTSLSMDLHKYAFAAKGASVILYKNNQLRQHQIFTHSGWLGYTIINPTFQNTKPGGPLAGAWAVLRHVGKDGYSKIGEALKQATDAFIAGVGEIDDLFIMGEPDICLVAFGSDTIDVFELCDELKARGWYVGPLPGAMGIKPSAHLTILPRTTANIAALLSDLRECVAIVRERAPSPLIAQFKALVSGREVATLSDEVIGDVLAMVGIKDHQLPDRRADFNAILNELPAPIVDRIMTSVHNGATATEVTEPIPEPSNAVRSCR